MNQIEFVAHPNSRDIAIVKAWLEEEDRMAGHSFICNWATILHSFDHQKACCLRIMGEAIAFMIWQNVEGDKVADILVTAVKPDLRGQGYGGELIRQALSLLHQRGVMAAKLECFPIESESFWRKQGFECFPQGYSAIRRGAPIELFRSLAELSQITVSSSSLIVLELWHKSILEVKDDDCPTLRLELPISFQGQFLVNVGIPAKPDWKVRLTFQDGEKLEDKVKYMFSPSCYENDFIVGVPQLGHGKEWILGL